MTVPIGVGTVAERSVPAATAATAVHNNCYGSRLVVGARNLHCLWTGSAGGRWKVLSQHISTGRRLQRTTGAPAAGRWSRRRRQRAAQWTSGLGGESGVRRGRGGGEAVAAAYEARRTVTGR